MYKRYKKPKLLKSLEEYCVKNFSKEEYPYAIAQSIWTLIDVEEKGELEEYDPETAEEGTEWIFVRVDEDDKDDS